jgi:hypothetical protein
MVVVEKDTPAPFKGVLVDDLQMKQFRLINEQKKNLEKQNLKLKDLQLVNEGRIDLYKDEAKHYQTQMRKERSKAFWGKVIYFSLGVVVTGIAAKAAIEATR